MTSSRNPDIPVEKGIVCIRPEPACWGARLQENRRDRIDDAARDPNGRLELLNRARAYTRRLLGADGPSDGDAAIVGTGHQATWHHCGVWAKTLVATRFARAAKAIHLHVVVDHDLSDTALVLPGRTAADGWTCHREELETDPRSVPLEMREPPPAWRVAGFVRAVAEQNPAGFCADAWQGAPGPRKEAPSRFQTVGDVITYLHALINERLHVAPGLYLPVSELSASDSFFRFAGAVMADAIRFSSLYNEAILADRSAEESRRVARLLTIDQNRNHAEVPFWLVDAAGRRLPLYVSRRGEGVVQIGVAGRPLGELDVSADAFPEQLRKLWLSRGYRLRPRAVTLTLFVRLILADWFVHGTGGAAYERIGDYLFEHFYERRPPCSALATCTMTLPEDEPPEGPGTRVGDVRRELRALAHHPERFIPAQTADKEPAATLVRLKQAAVNTACDRRLPHDQRKAAWKEIARWTQELQSHARLAADLLHQRLVEAQECERSIRISASREYFFGLFPERRLRALAGSVACETFGPGSSGGSGARSPSERTLFGGC